MKVFSDVPPPPRGVGIADVDTLAIDQYIRVETDIQAEAARMALRSLGRKAKRRYEPETGGYRVWRVS